MDVNVRNVSTSLTSWSSIRLEKLIVADLSTMPKDQAWFPRRALEVSLHEQTYGSNTARCLRESN